MTNYFLFIFKQFGKEEYRAKKHIKSIRIREFYHRNYAD